LLDLTVSNPTEAFGYDYPHDQIAKALGGIADFRYQPHPFGCWEARLAITHHLEKRLPDVHLSPSQVALTSSTSEAYAVLFKLLANPGDEVLVPSPSYPLFEYLAQLEAVRLRPYHLQYDGNWYIDFSSLDAAVSPRTRALILVNPNNPTGSFLKAPEYEQLRHFSIAHNVPLISDEVFMEYAFAESTSRIVSLNGRNDVLSFTLNGLSKSAGMPQMKLGWIAVNGTAPDRDTACERLELILDTYLSVGAPVQLSLNKLLDIGAAIRDKIRSRVLSNLQTLDRLLKNRNIHRLPCEGGWSAILRIPQIVSEDDWIHRLLLDKGVIVQPGYFFDMPGEAFLVVSLLTPEPVMQEGLHRILELEVALDSE
jgi:aspartate/methionine/tyrosine aminotransferase